MSKIAALITVNPTIDILFQGEDFSFNQKVFAKLSQIAVGGSAVNIARGLQALEQPFKLYIIIGGVIGGLVHDLLIKEGVPFYSVQNNQETRVTAISMKGRQRRMLVTPSPEIEPGTLRKFVDDHYPRIAKHDFVLIGGSVPKESSEYLAQNVVSSLVKEGVRVIIDSRGLFAERACAKVPYVVRYNKEVKLNSTPRRRQINQCIRAACDLYKKGSSLVIYNTNKYCYAIYDRHIWRYPNYTQFTKPIYGRGDAFLAGLISALLDDYNFSEAVRFAVACGASFTSDFPLGEICREIIPNHLCNIQYDVKRRIL